eukprot:13005302-Alexandrium_andersonii.AAC.1
MCIRDSLGAARLAPIRTSAYARRSGLMHRPAAPGLPLLRTPSVSPASGIVRVTVSSTGGPSARRSGLWAPG